MKNLLLICLFGLVLAISTSQMTQGCAGVQNTAPLVRADLQFVSQTSNGKIFQVPYDQRYVHIVQVWGTEFQQGKAYGTLTQKNLHFEMNNVLETSMRIAFKRGKSFHYLPKWLRTMIHQKGAKGMKKVVDLLYSLQEKFLLKKVDDFTKGVVQGSGISVQTLLKMKVFTNLMSVDEYIGNGGFNGQATASGKVIFASTSEASYQAASYFPTILITHQSDSQEDPSVQYGWYWTVFRHLKKAKKAQFLGSHFFPTGSNTGLDSFDSVELTDNFAMSFADKIDPSEVMAPKALKQAQKDGATQGYESCKEVIDAFTSARPGGEQTLGLSHYASNDYYIVVADGNDVTTYDHSNHTVDANHPISEGMLWDFQNDDNSCLKNHFLGNTITPELLYRYALPRNMIGKAGYTVYDSSTGDIFVGYSNPFSQDSSFKRPILQFNVGDAVGLNIKN